MSLSIKSNVRKTRGSSLSAFTNKFIISGLGSVELKEKAHESLSGRKRLFELNKVSLKEFMQFKTEYRYEDRLDEYLRGRRDEGMRFLMKYLNFGGYTRVILKDALEEKLKIIDEIYRSYIERVKFIPCLELL